MKCDQNKTPLPPTYTFRPLSGYLESRDGPIIGFNDLFNRYRLIGIDTHHISIGIIGIGMVPNLIIGIGMVPHFIIGIFMVSNLIIGIGINCRHIPIYLADNRYLSALIGIS